MVVPLVEAARLGQAFGAEVVVATAPAGRSSGLARCGLVDRGARGQPGHGPPMPDPARRCTSGARGSADGYRSTATYFVETYSSMPS